MYRFFRTSHRWIGIVAALFLATIGVTGFLLATKDTLGWVKPPTQAGGEYESLDEVISVAEAAEAAFSVGIEELQSYEDIDRLDYRPNKNVYKVRSETGYHEVQVDGKTGEILQVGKRTDQLTEDIHDFRFFAEWIHKYWLPVIAIILTSLAATGIVIFFVPYVRRWRYRKSKGG